MRLLPIMAPMTSAEFEDALTAQRTLVVMFTDLCELENNGGTHCWMSAVALRTGGFSRIDKKQDSKTCHKKAKWTPTVSPCMLEVT